MLSVGVYFSYALKGSSKADISLTKTDSLLISMLPKGSEMLVPQTELIKKQYAFLQTRKTFYRDLALMYNKYLYTFGILQVIFATISTLFLVYIAKDGWDSVTNWYIKFSMIISIFCASLFLILPKVLNNKNNIEKNLEMTIDFEKQQVATLSDIKSFHINLDSSVIDSLILRNYKFIREHQEFSFLIDTSKMKDPINN